MAPPNRMSLRPGLLWLTLNLVLIILCLSRHYIYYIYIYIYIYQFFFSILHIPVRCLRVPQVESHWSRKCGNLDVSQPYRPAQHVTGIDLPYTYRTFAFSYFKLHSVHKIDVLCELCFNVWKYRESNSLPSLYCIFRVLFSVKFLCLETGDIGGKKNGVEGAERNSAFH
jgi:hypothetical protein